MGHVTPESDSGVAHGERLKLHAQAPSNQNIVTGYGPDYIEVSRVRHKGSLLLAPDSAVQSWGVLAIAQATAVDFDPVLALEPELVLVGTGARQHFLPPQVLRPLIEAGVGFEMMDTGAACRTFNILTAEGRRVVGAFVLPGPIEGEELAQH